MSDHFSDIDLWADERVFIPDSDSTDYGSESKLPVRVSVDHYPPKLPLEIALCQSYEEQVAVAEKFCLTEAELNYILERADFRRAVSEQLVMLRESGHSFKIKCRAIAEDFLEELDLNLHSSEVGLTTKLDIFKTMTRLGELEPTKKAEAQGSNLPQVNIMINL